MQPTAGRDGPAGFLTTRDVTEVCQVDYRKVKIWCDKGVLKSSQECYPFRLVKPGDLCEFLKTWTGDTGVLFERVDAYCQILTSADGPLSEFAGKQIDLFSALDIAQLCRVSDTTVCRWFSQQRLPSFCPPDCKKSATSRQNLIKFLKSYSAGSAAILTALETLQRQKAALRIEPLQELLEQHRHLEAKLNKPSRDKQPRGKRRHHHVPVQPEAAPLNQHVWLLGCDNQKLTAKATLMLQSMGFNCTTVSQEDLMEQRLRSSTPVLVARFLPAARGNCEERSVVISNQEGILRGFLVTQ